MEEMIVVTVETHPEFYRESLNLGLDLFGGDTVTVDRSTGKVYRLPLTNASGVHYLRKEDPIWASLPEVPGKPANNAEMTAFLGTLGITERTDIHGALMRRGWARTDAEAGQLMNECGWRITHSSDDGWEPGIT